jgi:hypothetical protein
VAGGQGIGHIVERRTKAADFRGTIFEAGACCVITISPFGGDLQKTLDWTADEFPATGPDRINRRKKPARMSPTPRRVALSISANASAFD